MPMNEEYTLLFVDDEPNVLKAMRRLFMEEDYHILTSDCADEALAVLEKETVHLVISDHRMPGMTGAELLREIKKRWPNVIRIMLTGYADVQSIMAAVNEGAVYKFITKPWNDEDLRISVRLALRQYALIEENKNLKKLANEQQKQISKYASVLDENKGLIGAYLVRTGKISREQLNKATAEKKRDELLGDTLVRLGFITEGKIVNAFKDNLKLDYVDLAETRLDPAVVKFLPRDLCERNRLIPIKLAGREITLAMADPSDIFKCDNISMMTSLKVDPVIARSTAILKQIRKVYGDYEGNGDDIELISGKESQVKDSEDEIDIIIEEEEQINIQELINSSDIPPVIRIVNAIIAEALRSRASDVHIEPKSDWSLVRYRIDGMLVSKIRIPSDLHRATISRIKIIAKLDISERRLPQDGRMTLKYGSRFIDFRVATMPTINGEKVVLRVLDKSASIKSLEELGVLSDDQLKIKYMLNRPQGMVISTGPTGSGKTTLLYSMLNVMLSSAKNYQTIEDPVEYFLDQANQIFVREKTGLTFPSVLRATLRQDPDVILVGEIRDRETADIAFKAALTGHMVLSSLHTNSSVSSITRLIDMQVKPYLIASALEGIIAQRLVRKICLHCRKESSPDPGLLQLLNIPQNRVPEKVFQGKGCHICNNTGYAGRTGVFEFFIMNDDFRHFISSDYKEAKLLKMAGAGGMTSLMENGIQKVVMGETTLDELLRVIGAQTRYERQCDNCRKMVETGFLFCPYCGAVKRNFCRNCMIQLEEDWIACPACGREKA